LEYDRAMFVLIVGVGRVGSSLACRMLEEGHEVSCVDEDADALGRLDAGLGRDWVEAGGSLTVGQALELDALLAAGIERADAFVAATDGDNTNIVVAQIAQRQFAIPTVIARVLDPLRAAWYEQQGLLTISPTKVAIEMLEREVRAADQTGGGR
jgi:trk system potassium uptake protein